MRGLWLTLFNLYSKISMDERYSIKYHPRLGVTKAGSFLLKSLITNGHFLTWTMIGTQLCQSCCFRKWSSRWKPRVLMMHLLTGLTGGTASCHNYPRANNDHKSWDHGNSRLKLQQSAAPTMTTELVGSQGLSAFSVVQSLLDLCTTQHTVPICTRIPIMHMFGLTWEDIYLCSN